MKAANRVTIAVSTGLLMVGAGLLSPTVAHAETVRGVECTILGTDGDDVLRGTSEDDVICGLEGDDVLIGLGGDDVLVGGPGGDELRGGRGDDALIGGGGQDDLKGGPGADHLTVGAPKNNGLIVDIVPVFKLPIGTRVQFMTSPTNIGTCFEQAAASWGYVVGDPIDFHFLIEGSARPECLGKTTTYKWRVRVTTPDDEQMFGQVGIAVKFPSPSSVIPEGTTTCQSEDLQCAGATTTQKLSPLLPLYATVSIGPKEARR